MRNFIRSFGIVALAASSAFVVFFFWENVSKALDEFGANTFLFRGVSMINELGYGGVAIGMTLILFGFVAGTWLDFFLRRWEQRSIPKIAHLTLEFGHIFTAPHAKNMKNVNAWATSGIGRDYELFVVFENPITDPSIIVMADKPDVSWTEIFSNDRFIRLKINHVKDDTRVYFDFLARSEIGNDVRRQATNVTYKTVFIERSSEA